MIKKRNKYICFFVAQSKNRRLHYTSTPFFVRFHNSLVEGVKTETQAVEDSVRNILLRVR